MKRTYAFLYITYRVFSRFPVCLSSCMIQTIEDFQLFPKYFRAYVDLIWYVSFKKDNMN